MGGKELAAGPAPTGIDRSPGRSAAASGEPPRKRLRLPGGAGNSRVSFGIDVSWAESPVSLLRRDEHGEPVSRRQMLSELYFVRPSAFSPASPAGRPRAAACPSAAG